MAIEGENAVGRPFPTEAVVSVKKSSVRARALAREQSKARSAFDAASKR